MKNRSNVYWEDRVNQILADNQRAATPDILRINQAYDRALKDVQHDIDKIFIKYAKGHNLTLAQAKQFLNDKIPNNADELRLRLTQTSNEELKKSILAELNKSAYKARITRLEALKQSLSVNYRLLADKEIELSSKAYINTIKESYYRNIFEFQKGINMGFNVAQINDRAINMILNTEWVNGKFSKRVWKNTEVLYNSLDGIITRGIISGKSLSEISKELEKQTDLGKFATERLVRTETTFFNNQAALKGYEEVGIEKYVFVATLDLRTSKVCQQHDRRVYRIKDQLPGTNCPPMHPFCRSTIRSYINEEILNRAKRRARDPETGKTYLVDNMSYKEWHNKYVDAAKDNLNRKTRNIGDFKGLQEPMQLKHVRKVAREAGIDLTDIKIKIQRNSELIKLPIVGSASPEQVGRIDLLPNAFIDREQLLRTLAHEKVHVRQYKEHGSKHVMENREKFEEEAYRLEEEWYNDYKQKGE